MRLPLEELETRLGLEVEVVSNIPVFNNLGPEGGAGSIVGHFMKMHADVMNA